MNDSTSLAEPGQTDFIALTADIVSAYVSNNSVPMSELPTLLSAIHSAIAGLSSASASDEPEVDKPTPAQIRKSITPDALISFIDGKPYKMLKRHVTGNGMTIEQYREHYGLPRDYPTTAASYSAMRAEFARSNGLGRQRRKAAEDAANTAESVTDTPKARGQKNSADSAEKPVKARKPKKAAAA